MSARLAGGKETERNRGRGRGQPTGIKTFYANFLPTLLFLFFSLLILFAAEGACLSSALKYLLLFNVEKNKTRTFVQLKSRHESCAYSEGKKENEDRAKAEIKIFPVCCRICVLRARRAWQV